MLLADPALEHAPCPMGCAAPAASVVRARDRELGLPGEFTVVRCTGCGLLRTDPRPTPESMAAYYPDDYAPYDSSHGGGAGSRRRRLLRRVLSVRDRATPSLPPGRLLEIGCSNGWYLDEMRARGWEVSGVELSAHAAEEARAKGHPVWVGPVECFPAPEEPVDLVVAWMALEHLHEPAEVLRRMRAAVRPGGWLAISVPNAGSLERRLFGQHWYALALPRHLHHFTPATIGRLLEETGWRPERVIHQRTAANLAASIGRVLEDRPRTAALGRRLVDLSSRTAWVAKATYPLAVVLAALGQTGRMTVWARAAE